MKKEQELIQSLGIFGIFKLSFIITFSWVKLFTQITVSTIFPLSLLFLIQVQISDLFLQQNTASFWLLKTVYFVLFLVFSMLSTSAVVYTVTCIYMRKEVITYVQVMSVVPKIWKRLMVTFAWSFMVILAYNTTSFYVLIPWFGSTGPNISGVMIVGPLMIMYMIGFVYISIIWHLASVVSVLEEVCGVEAMIKSHGLVKGKMVISFAIFLFLNLCFVLVQEGFQRFAVVGESFWSRIGCGVLCFFLLSGFTFLGLVVQTLIYLVCKSYHSEIIGKLYLEDHLEGYLGDYGPLRSRDDQLEQLYV